MVAGNSMVYDHIIYDNGFRERMDTKSWKYYDSKRIEERILHDSGFSTSYFLWLLVSLEKTDL